MDFDQIFDDASEVYELAAGRVRPETGGVSAWRNRLTVHQFRFMFRWIDRYARPGASVLDWGSGAGMFSYFLIKAGFTVQALDMVSPLLLAELEGVGDRYRFTPAPDVRTLPYPDASLDLVLSVGVLEHVRDTGGDEVASLREIRRVLKPTGTFLCCHLPNKWSWVDWAARSSTDRHYHEFRYVRADIQRWAAESDLTVREFKRYGALPRNSLGRLPPRVGDSRFAARVVDSVDDALGRVFSSVVQNFGFVATPVS